MRKATAYSCLSGSPFKPRSTRRASVDSAVETHEAAIRHVPSRRFLLTGTSRPARARAGGKSGAEEPAARRRAFARGTVRRARADGRPDASAACLGVPPARSPGAKHSLSSIVIVRYFSCACFERWRETQGGDGRRRALHADAARRTMAPASRDVPCRRAWTCGSWLCRCTRRSTPADLPRRPTEGAVSYTHLTLPTTPYV